MVFTAQQSLADAVAFAQGLKDRAEAEGRSRDSLLVMPGVSIYVAPTRAEAQAKFDALQAFIDPAHSEAGYFAPEAHFAMGKPYVRRRSVTITARG